MYDESFDFSSADDVYMFYTEPSTSGEDTYCSRCKLLIKNGSEYCPICGSSTISPSSY